MRKILHILIIIFLAVPVFAQTISFTGGDKAVSLGAGYKTSLYDGEQWKMLLPPVSFTFDMCIIDSIGYMKQSVGIGTVINLQKAKTEYSVPGSSKKEGVVYHKWNFGLRPSYHFYVKKKFDVYAGVVAWYKYNDMEKYGPVSKIPTNDATDGLKFAVFVGYRYYFSKQIAFFAEAESHVLWVSAGITIRFR